MELLDTATRFMPRDTSADPGDACFDALAAVADPNVDSLDETSYNLLFVAGLGTRCIPDFREVRRQRADNDGLF